MLNVHYTASQPGVTFLLLVPPSEILDPPLVSVKTIKEKQRLRLKYPSELYKANTSGKHKMVVLCGKAFWQVNFDLAAIFSCLKVLSCF